MATDRRFDGERGLAFRFHRGVPTDFCGHFDGGMPEELLHLLQASRLLINNTRGRMPEDLNACLPPFAKRFNQS